MISSLSDVPAFGIFFSVYEFLLRYLTPKGKWYVYVLYHKDYIYECYRSALFLL